MTFEDALKWRFIAGFLSGRGHFFIKDVEKGGKMYKEPGLKVSSRDIEIVEYLKDELGFGYITHSGKNHIFWITKREDLKKLIEKVKDHLLEKENVEEILELIG